MAQGFNPGPNLHGNSKPTREQHFAAKIKLQVFPSVAVCQVFELLYLDVAIVHIDFPDDGVCAAGVKLEPEISRPTVPPYSVGTVKWIQLASPCFCCRSKPHPKCLYVQLAGFSITATLPCENFHAACAGHAMLKLAMSKQLETMDFNFAVFISFLRLSRFKKAHFLSRYAPIPCHFLP
jgi:hypothetical protein